MIYNLYVKKNGANLIYKYDTYLNRFYDETGKDLISSDNIKTEEWNSYSYSTNDTIYTYKNQFELLEIVLGGKCNFNCIYCSQRTFRDKLYSSSPKDIDRFINILLKNKIKPNSIQLWGGEPLVYWKVIKELVPKLRSIYPDIDISFPTNGSLLDREKVDFIRQHKMKFWISHDGPNNMGREEDGHKNILKDPVVLDAINYAYDTLPYWGISFKSTFTHGNTDAQKIIRFFKTDVNKKSIVSTNNVVLCHDINNEISKESSKLTRSDLITLISSVYSVLNSTDTLDEDPTLINSKLCLMDSFVRKIPVTQVGTECGLPYGETVTVDLNGNILKCHNFGLQPGNLTLNNMIGKPIYGYNHALSRETNCKDCLVIQSCRGACPAIDNEAQKLRCINNFGLHFGIFKSAVSSLFGVYLERVEKTNEDNTVKVW